MSKLAIAIITAAGLPILAKLGFSEVCSNEVLSLALPLPGAIWAWYESVKSGHFTLGGKQV